MLRQVLTKLDFDEESSEQVVLGSIPLETTLASYHEQFVVGGLVSKNMMQLMSALEIRSVLLSIF